MRLIKIVLAGFLSTLMLTGCVSHYQPQSNTYIPKLTFPKSNSNSSTYGMYDSDIEKCWNDSNIGSDKVSPVSCIYSHDYEVVAKGSCENATIDLLYDYYTVKSNSNIEYCLKSKEANPVSMVNASPLNIGDSVDGYLIVSTSSCIFFNKKFSYSYVDFARGFSESYCGEKKKGF